MYQTPALLKARVPLRRHPNLMHRVLPVLRALPLLDQHQERDSKSKDPIDLNGGVGHILRSPLLSLNGQTASTVTKRYLEAQMIQGE